MTVSGYPRRRSGGEAPFLNCFSGSPSAKRRRGAFFALFLIDSRQRSGEIELSRRGTPSAKWWRGAFFELFLIDPRQRTGGEEASPRPGRPNSRGGLFFKIKPQGRSFSQIQPQGQPLSRNHRGNLTVSREARLPRFRCVYRFFMARIHCQKTIVFCMKKFS